MKTYEIGSINGPVVTVSGPTSLTMMEMVYVGRRRLVGEVIGITSRATTIQVYEETAGLRPGEPVEGTGFPMSVTLGPGLLGNIYDGVQKPLRALKEQGGAFLPKGVETPAIDEEKTWDVTMRVKEGDRVSGGQVFAVLPETQAIEHRALLPPDVSGTVVFAEPDGAYRVTDTLLRVRGDDGRERDVRLAQRWPIKTARPVKTRLPVSKPMLTGQRVIDTLFPIAMGGAAAIPGGFGTGKTVTQHQLAKFADADVIVYVGCGERGNEMTQALQEFSELVDPHTGRPLLERTILIANTSNMPVAAREASIYTGITLAEYYRDMGYNAAMMADSTSRWAEALREISGRLEEMPADEGYPAYLPSRLSDFYERAGYFKTLSGAQGAVTLIGAVSPQGADFSEPVTQNTKRFTRCFWALDKNLAYARHYPAINWNESYSEYVPELTEWYAEHAAPDFMECRTRIAAILAEETKLAEIVKLVGAELLPDDQKITMETARVIRVGFLQQNALDPTDTSTPLKKHYRMMQVILRLYDLAQDALKAQVPASVMIASGAFDRVTRMKTRTPNDDLSCLDALERELDETFASF